MSHAIVKKSVEDDDSTESGDGEGNHYGVKGPRVRIEGELPLWTKDKLKRIGLNLWEIKSLPYYNLPEVLVVTAEAQRNPSRFLRMCRDRHVPMCTEAWLHACAGTKDKGKPRPSYEIGPWCFQMDDVDSSESEHEESNQERQRTAEIGGIRITYDYIDWRHERDEWEAISFVRLGKNRRRKTLAIRRPCDTQVVEACLFSTTAMVTAVSMMEKASFPTIRPVRGEDLPDRMDDIYVVAYCQSRGNWVLCVWKDEFDDSDDFDDRGFPFKLVESNALKLKYKSDEVEIWLDKVRRTALLTPMIHESRAGGGTDEFKVVMQRLERWSIDE